jgi:hypothetical protein
MTLFDRPSIAHCKGSGPHRPNSPNLEQIQPWPYIFSFSKAKIVSIYAVSGQKIASSSAIRIAQPLAFEPQS